MAARKVYVVEAKSPRGWYGPDKWEPYRAFNSREDAEAQLASNKGAAFKRRIRVYVPKEVRRG